MFNKKLIDSYEKAISELKAAHEKHVAALSAHIGALQKLVFVPTTYSNIPFHQMEADAVLSVRETNIQLTDEEKKRREDEISERDRVLSGTY